ncbi:MAG: methyltransferase [Sediminibacterium sp.]
MKVTTDACLFGAWVAGKVRDGKYKVQNGLDIGTGTGLLGLMVAQENNLLIDAVEIDPAAAQQAAENFGSSPWKHRLQVHLSPIQQFNLSGHQQYDFIFSNPPFFESDLKSPDSKKNLALHSEALTLEALLQVIKHTLAPQGRFALLLPYHRSVYFKTLAVAEGFYMEEEMLVKQTTMHDYFRSMQLYGRKNRKPVETTLCIQENGKYTDDFVALLKAYYLNL